MQIGYLIMMTSNQQRGYVFNNFFSGWGGGGGLVLLFLGTLRRNMHGQIFHGLCFALLYLEWYAVVD